MWTKGLCAALAAVAVSAGLCKMAWAEGPVSGIDRAGFDTSVKPGDDFFQYVNGEWIRKNPIPADQSDWGAFEELHEQNYAWLKEIAEGIGADARDGDRQKVRDFYREAMDEGKIEKLGVSPLRGEFERIEKVGDAASLMAEVARLQVMGVEAVFEFGVWPDNKDSTRYAAQLAQGGMGLPEKQYYLGEDADSKKIRGEYLAHVTKMLELLGDSPEMAAAGAEVVLRVETELAKVARTPTQNRDVEALYNKRTVAELKSGSPGVDWGTYFQGIGVGEAGPAYVVVGQPEFFAGVGKMVESGVTMEEWRTYLRWQLIHSTARFLNSDFEKEDFRFYRQVLAGTKEMWPRWKRSVATMDRLLGQPLGKLYVEKHFPAAARDKVRTLVENIVAAYDQRIVTRNWMDEKTKEQARAKLKTVMRKIGYPDKWRDYSKLQINTDSYVQNVLRAREWDFNYWRERIGGTVDKTEWQMTPPTVNAYYDSSMNEIVFPAGILQPPFFNAQADDAVNYGAIGAVIGHEITHGFDDQGCLFDAEGNMRNWWTPADKKNFDARAARLVDQFDACVVLDGLHVNGKLTLGENIADLGGVTIAYAAYLRSLGGKEPPVIDGLTGAQRFFMGYAQQWRSENRPERMRMRLRTDPHSPERFRVNVPVSNFGAFYDAFKIGEGEKMYLKPGERVEVW